MPKVSVIIPIYNSDKYLRECLDSVINQTLTDIEIICVNDGSTDNSGKILDEYAQKDNRIKVVTQENKGLSGARNTGLEYITSEYCYFLDSDDYIEPDLLQTAYNVLSRNEVDYYCFGTELIINNNDTIQNLDSLRKYLTLKLSGTVPALFDVGLNQNIHVWNKIFKTSVIKDNNIKFIVGLLYEDIFFTWYYFFLSKKIYFDSKIYHHYRIHSKSIMERTEQKKSYDSAVSHLYNWHELFVRVSKNKELFKKNYRNLLILLRNYRKRTIEMSPSEDRNKICKLAKNYKKELDKVLIKEYGIIKFLICSQNIFWISKGIRLALCICGLKLKINLKRFNKELSEI